MESLNIKNIFLRCENCFMLKQITIEPNYPQSTICTECACGLSRHPLITFLSDIEKEESFKIKCSFCGREPKNPTYCTGCRRTYCSICKEVHDYALQINNPHKMIDSYKFDFYCSTHQEELINAYCKTCSLNICQHCINEKIHKGHRFIKYSKLVLKEKDEENLKQNLKKNEDKIEGNIKKCNEILKQQNKEEKQNELKEVCNSTTKDNKSILQLINYFYKLYKEIKHKNYSVIFNLTENIKFNPQPIPPEGGASIEQKTTDFLEYLKRDFVLFKRFNAPKISSNASGNIQMNPPNKKLDKHEDKEDENKEFKTDLNTTKKEEKNDKPQEAGTEKEKIDNEKIEGHFNINKENIIIENPQNIEDNNNKNMNANIANVNEILNNKEFTFDKNEIEKNNLEAESINKNGDLDRNNNENINNNLMLNEKKDEENINNEVQKDEIKIGLNIGIKKDELKIELNNQEEKDKNINKEEIKIDEKENNEESKNIFNFEDNENVKSELNDNTREDNEKKEENKKKKNK